MFYHKGREGHKVIAIVPARGGSRGLPRKNLLPLGGIPLVAWSILAAKASRHVDRVIVSTEDQEIASIASEYGAEVPELRPANLASDNCSLGEVVFDTTEKLFNSDKAADQVVVLPPTNPFRTPELIDLAIQESRFNTFNVATVRPFMYNPDQHYYIKDGIFKQFGEPIWLPAFQKVGLVYCSSKYPTYFEKLLSEGEECTFLAWRSIIAGDQRFRQNDRFIFVTDKTMLIDIDTVEDFKFAEKALVDGKVPWIPGSKSKSRGFTLTHVPNSYELPSTIGIQESTGAFHKVLYNLPADYLTTPSKLRSIIESRFDRARKQNLLISSLASINNVKNWYSTTSLNLPTIRVNRAGVIKPWCGVSLCEWGRIDLFFKPSLRWHFGPHFVTSGIKFDISQDRFRLLESPRLADKVIITIRVKPLHLGTEIVLDYLNNRWVKSVLYEWDQKLVNRVKLTGPDFEIDTTPPLGSITLRILRPSYELNNSIAEWGPIEVPNLLSYEKDMNEWCNLVTGEIIAGRDQFPVTYKWDGMAYLPAIDNLQDKWEYSLC